MKRGAVILVSSIDIGMSIKKELDALTMTLIRCIMKRCIAIDCARIEIGMSIKKELDALMLACR